MVKNTKGEILSGLSKRSRAAADWQKIWLAGTLLRYIFLYAFRQTGSLRSAAQVVRQLSAKKAKIFGPKQSRKVYKIAGRYYYHLNAPGYPSLACRHMLENEVNKITRRNPVAGLRILFLGMTTKCPLNCEHCLEGDYLNRKEVLSDQDLIRIIHKFQDYRTTQIMLTGGEPLIHYKRLLKLLKAKKAGTDFWIITSGVSLNQQKAQALKEAGLTGLLVSLDHHLPEENNAFRGYTGAYEAALNAIRCGQAAGLVTGLSICLTRNYVNAINIEAYLELAKSSGVTFVQWLEPQAVGRYAGKEVALRPEQQALLHGYYEQYNSDPAYQDYPVIEYAHGNQRRTGCLGRGAQFLYIDTMGQVQLCPFCRGKTLDARELSAGQIMAAIKQGTCPAY